MPSNQRYRISDLSELPGGLQTTDLVGIERVINGEPILFKLDIDTLAAGIGFPSWYGKGFEAVSTGVSGDDTGEVIIAPTERFDDFGAYNHLTGVFTAPATGLYALSFSAQVTVPTANPGGCCPTILRTPLVGDYEYLYIHGALDKLSTLFTLNIWAISGAVTAKLAAGDQIRYKWACEGLGATPPAGAFVAAVLRAYRIG